MDIDSIMEMWNSQMAKVDGRNHTENTVLFILSQAMNEWKQYKEIGTIEEFRRLKENENKKLINGLRELRRHPERAKDYDCLLRLSAERLEELSTGTLTIPAEIAKELNCGINTVNRRLGMKDY